MAISRRNNSRRRLAASLALVLSLSAVREASASAAKGLTVGLLSEAAGHAATAKCGWHRMKKNKGSTAGAAYGDHDAKQNIRKNFGGDYGKYTPILIDVEYWARKAPSDGC